MFDDKKNIHKSILVRMQYLTSNIGELMNKKVNIMYYLLTILCHQSLYAKCFRWEVDNYNLSIKMLMTIVFLYFSSFLEKRKPAHLLLPTYALIIHLLSSTSMFRTWPLTLLVAAPAGQGSVNCATPTLPSPTMPTYTMAAQTNGQSSEAVYTNGIQQYATGEYG